MFSSRGKVIHGLGLGMELDTEGPVITKHERAEEGERPWMFHFKPMHPRGAMRARKGQMSIA